MFEQSKEAIDVQAAAWAARSLSGSMTQQEEGALQDWLRADLSHNEAYEAYLHVANCASVAADMAAEAALEEEIEGFASRQKSQRQWFVAIPAIAASIAAVAFLVSVVMGPGESYTTYATLRGENKKIDLADGTVVALNTDTEIEVLIDARRRAVRLVRGEALFDVARDPQRRFIVTSDTAQTSVLGTRFNFYEKPGETVVSVLSGVVEVGTAHLDAPPVTLIAGQEVAIKPNDARPEVRDFKPDAVISWRRGLAYHENEPLWKVIADLNRYFATELVIGDSVLNDIPVTGGFDITDQSVAVESLSIALSLRAEQSDTNQIVLFSDE